MNLLLLALLPVAHAGILIGNPPQVMPRIATLDEGAVEMWADVVRTDITTCGGSVSTLLHTETVDLADDWRPFFPAGEWCTLTVTFAGPPLRCDADGCEAVFPQDIALGGPQGLTIEWIVLPGPVATGS